MSMFDAILLGIIQGLTEFLPVSSTAHLTLAGKMLGLIAPANAAAWTSFIAVLQLGTLVAVLVYFARDLGAMTAALIADFRTNGGGAGLRGFRPESRLALLIIVGTVPVGLAGLLLNDILHSMFTKSTVVMIASLVGLALLLWIAERKARHARAIEDLGLRDALVIGGAQALALIPGASRSGTTITAALFLGCTRPAAARFSFLLSIPAVLASGIHELKGIDPGVFAFGITNLIAGTVVAGIAGYAAIAWLLRFLNSNSTMVFVWYRIALGVLLLVLLLSGHIEL
jgi:undecaprenyl-diphosphatase